MRLREYCWSTGLSASLLGWPGAAMECRVLSIQSHVVRGYVGNKSASFPLQVNTNIVHPLSVIDGRAAGCRLTRSSLLPATWLRFTANIKHAIINLQTVPAHGIKVLALFLPAESRVRHKSPCIITFWFFGFLWLLTPSLLVSLLRATLLPNHLEIVNRWHSSWYHNSSLICNYVFINVQRPDVYSEEVICPIIGPSPIIG